MRLMLLNAEPMAVVKLVQQPAKPVAQVSQSLSKPNHSCATNSKRCPCHQNSTLPRHKILPIQKAQVRSQTTTGPCLGPVVSATKAGTLPVAGCHPRKVLQNPGLIVGLAHLCHYNTKPADRIKAVVQDCAASR